MSITVWLRSSGVIKIGGGRRGPRFQNFKEGETENWGGIEIEK